jgi:DNA-binding transcriptional regulator PaaX
MVVAFDECARPDPLLPPELLPPDWPGKEARDLLARGRKRALEISPLLRQSALFRAFDPILNV